MLASMQRRRRFEAGVLRLQDDPAPSSPRSLMEAFAAASISGGTYPAGLTRGVVFACDAVLISVRPSQEFAHLAYLEPATVLTRDSRRHHDRLPRFV